MATKKQAVAALKKLHKTRSFSQICHALFLHTDTETCREHLCRIKSGGRNPSPKMALAIVTLKRHLDEFPV